jgi:hypothetical protein
MDCEKGYDEFLNSSMSKKMDLINYQLLSVFSVVLRLLFVDTFRLVKQNMLHKNIVWDWIFKFMRNFESIKFKENNSHQSLFWLSVVKMKQQTEGWKFVLFGFVDLN